MDRTGLGVLVGVALAFAGHFGGFGAFLLVGALGGFVGHLLDDGRDWREFLVPGDRRIR